MNLDLIYKWIQLTILDPVSSAIFFYRKIFIFFEYYMKIREDSIFGYISQYFGTIKTNEYKAFYLYRFLWLYRNIHLNFILKDIRDKDQTVYRERVVQYIDNIFIQVYLSYNRVVQQNH